MGLLNTTTTICLDRLLSNYVITSPANKNHQINNWSGGYSSMDVKRYTVLDPESKLPWAHRTLFGKSVPWGALNFFSGRGVQPGFLKCGACELIFASEKGACELKIHKFWGLWMENFQILGLVSSKFPNLGACELNFGCQIEAVEAKISKFSQKGVLVNWLFCLKWDPCELQDRRGKGGLQGRTSPYPLSRSVPPPPMSRVQSWLLRVRFLGPIELIFGKLAHSLWPHFTLCISMERGHSIESFHVMWHHIKPILQVIHISHDGFPSCMAQYLKTQQNVPLLFI